MKKPVTGYFSRMMVKSMLRATNKPRLEWYSRFFRKDDRLRTNKSPEWVLIYCMCCHKEHFPWCKAIDEEREYQCEQRVYRKKMRRVTQLKARREWLTRLRPRRPKTTR